MSPGGYGNYEKQGKNYYTFIKMTERKMVKPRMLAKQLWSWSSGSHWSFFSMSSIVSSVQLLSHVQLFVNLWTATCQASLSTTNSWSLLELMSIELVMPSNHLILCCPLLLPLSIFPMSQLFASGGQSIGVSASISVFPLTPRTDLL